MFLTMTGGYSEKQRRLLALQVTLAVGVICFILFFYGTNVFQLLAINLDAFRIGSGALLFLSAVSLMQHKAAFPPPTDDDDIAVVPLALPIIVGPATIGTLLVLGAEISGKAQKTAGLLALLAATVSIGILLQLAALIERLLGKKLMTTLSKITGLVLSALAAQMIFTGIVNFLKIV